jgi:acyl carrier protein
MRELARRPTMNTLQRLRRLLANVLRIDESDVRTDSSVAELFDRHSGDSLDRVEFAMAVEEEFGELEVSDEEADEWEELIQTQTLEQFAEFIDRGRRPPT